MKKENIGGTGFQPVLAQAKACGYIFISSDRLTIARNLPDTIGIRRNFVITP
ncbi:MAG: hypothetical protein ACOC8G_00665 [Thermodesulfobacteriota bacterium]